CLVPEARMRWALVLAVAAAALFACGANAATVECAGIPTWIDVPGPWVAVPASGEAKFLLDCPQRRGVVGGVDALASSRHIHVTFEGLLGGPVAPGRTTTRYAFFRAVSGNHREGLFEPRIGCIPSSAGGPQTTAYTITPAGPATDLAAGLVEQRRSWRRWVPLALLLVALACASTALARPKARLSVPENNGTVVLVVDVSGSMRANDVEPTRLDAAVSAMRTFLDKLPPQFKVGLVSFSSEPEVLSAPTRDRQLVREALGSSIGRKTEFREVTSWFAAAAAVFLLGALGTGRLVEGRLP